MCFHVGFQFLAKSDKMLIVNLSHDLNFFAMAKVRRIFGMCKFIKNKIKQNFSKLFFVLATIWNAPWRLWNSPQAAPRPLYCLLVGDIISVLLSSSGTPAGLIAATRVRVCDGNAMNVR